MKQKTVPYSFLEECAEKNVCMSLSEENKKRTAKLITWRKRLWVCVGAAWRNGPLEAELIQVVPQEKFHGLRYCDFIEYGTEQHASHYYVGDVFTAHGKAYCITANKIRIGPENHRRIHS